MTDEAPRRTRIVLCMGQFCNMDRRAAKLLPLLEESIAAYSQQHPEHVVKLETASCLSMCGAGPNCVIYPGGKAINFLTAEKLTELAAKQFLIES